MTARITAADGARATRTRSVAAALLGVVTALALVLPASPASADTQPAAGTPETVSADALPTVQIDGVAWTQAVAGNTVYVGGSFATARPAGAAPGQSTTSRPNLLAYDIRTGNLVTSWSPAPNAQVRALAVSPDGKRLYVGGDFTSIAGQNRYRLAAFDTATGALVAGFNAVLDYQVKAIAATNTTVYVGGGFSKANNVARNRLAAFSAADGSLLAWNPSADNRAVQAMTLSPDSTSVYVGGSFTTFNGSSDPGFGLARVSAEGTGALLPLPANSVIRNAGDKGAILGLASDATNVYAVGYTWGRSGGTLEGTAAIAGSTGELLWVADCHGDSYSVFPHGGVVYNASHAHYCGNIGSFSQTNPQVDWTYYRGIALTKDATRVVGRDPLGYTNFEGQPGPTVVNWFPEIDWGTYTGQSQGAWSISGNAEYVVYGGEFRNVNATGQQGLVRFAVKSAAPNRRGPVSSGGSFAVNAEPVASGTVRVSWQANADQDNEFLVYRVIRNGAAGSPVHMTTYASQVWHRPMIGFTDTGLTPGQTYTYRVTATDPFGNAVSSPTVTVVADGTGSLSTYAQEVLRDGASHYWRLGEGSGSVAADTAAVTDGTIGSSVVMGRPGAIAGDPDTAADLGTSTNGWIQTSERYLSTNTFTLEAWVKATSSDRGRIVGFGDSNSMTAESSNRDRTLYIDSSGRINFGVWPAGARVVKSPSSITDNKWHHIVGTMGAEGLKLYLDGVEVAARWDGSVGGNYFGYWRIGGDGLSSWPGRPSGDYYGGLVDEVALYPGVMSAATVRRHHQLGTGTGGAPVNQPPVAQFTSSTSDLTVNVDGSASSDPDGSITGHAWTFGDGGTATGATASHTYAAAGTYTVTLTVTDDKGASASQSAQVTVTAPAPPPPPPTSGTVVASDTFERSAANGWGTAVAGGSWSTVAGAASNYSVSGGSGRMLLSGPGAGRSAILTGVSQQNVDATVLAALDKPATGGGTDLTLSGRWTGAGNEYRTQVKVLSTGGVRVALRKSVANSASTLTQVNVPGVTYAPGQQLAIRLQVVGTGPTTLRTKVWLAGTPEPAGWLMETTDATPELQAPGGVGLVSYLSGSATNAPVVASFDDFVVRAMP